MFSSVDQTAAHPHPETVPMKTITPFLWFDGKAEEAVNFYVSIFSNSRIVSMNRMGPDGPVVGVRFELGDRPFMALNGGPQFKFTEAISMFIECESQAEIDMTWDKLLAGGGSTQQCGWLKDRFGLSWQVVPSALGRLLGDPDRAKAQRVMQAMMQMVKLDIRGLEEAASGVKA
jgi:predicted 3-demethylubiquinone-9 3-methyltransferase (glyoxalase superfamily)